MDVENAFAELAAIDAELDEFSATQRDFRGLAARDEAAAKRAFRSAANALIETRDFTTYATLGDPKAEMKNLLRTHADMARNPGSFPGAGKMRERILGEKAGRIIAALVLGGRTAEARAAAAQARAATAVPATHEVLRRALEGTMPPPFVDPSWKSTWRHLMP